MARTSRKTEWTLDQLLNAVQSGKALWVRWSSGREWSRPQAQRLSKDHTTGEIHAGLSVNNIPSDADMATVANRVLEYSILGIEGNVPWVVTGQEVGRDSDIASCLAGAKCLGRVSEAALAEAIQIQRQAWIEKGQMYCLEVGDFRMALSCFCAAGMSPEEAAEMAYNLRPVWRKFYGDTE